MIDKKIREYILPIKILRALLTENEESLLKYNGDQPCFGTGELCKILPGGYVLLDFGEEYSGGIKLVIEDCCGESNCRIGISFGESAMEAMSEIGDKNSCNDHAIRSTELVAPWMGQIEYGNTGFRFARIKNINDFAISFKQVLAIFVHSDAIKKGSFVCSDERLNKIWEVGTRTIFLNMQDYVYDGIKRDRLVWIGDMHPETSAIIRLFGSDERVEKSLDLVKRTTKFTEWMNGIPSYSMWWLKIVYDYYFYTGDKSFVLEHIEYISKLTDRLLLCVEKDGTLNVDFKFIDWPSSENSLAQEAGVRALLYLAIESAKKLLSETGKLDEYTNKRYTETLNIIRKGTEKSTPNGNKQAAALMCFAGLYDDSKANEELLSKDPFNGISSFLGYYVLMARAKAGDMLGSLDLMRKYWGGMIDMGATTFWEDFNLDWLNNAKPIDAILENNEYDIHGDNGAYCYKGFRHSLCHGWSAGVVPFISEYVLGVKFKEVGCAKIEISPDLGDLLWAEGNVPTPYGVLKVSIKKTDNGIDVKTNELNGVEIVICNFAKG